MLISVVLLFALGGMFERASVVQMDLADCVAPQRSLLATLAGEPAISQRESCAEYVIASPTVIFRVQAKKSETLMVPGEVVSYRAGKGKLYLRRDDNGGELEATVLCMRAAGHPGDDCGLRPEETAPSVKTPVRARIDPPGMN